MPATGESGAWKRLGEMLERRRVEMDSRYRNRQLFVDERHLDYRLAYDVETGARANYRRPTLTAIEIAYGWEPGSVQRVLDGGEPVIAKAAEPEKPAEDETNAVLDAFEQAAIAWRDREEARKRTRSG